MLLMIRSRQYFVENERIATIALSVSGETEQTLMLAEKLKRRGSSLISITNKANCSLAKMSDCNINYYVSEYKYKQDEDYDLTSQMAVVFILELIGRELKGVHNDTDDLF